MVNAYSYDSNPASSRILRRIFPLTRKFSRSSAASDSLVHGGAFLSSQRRTEFISPVKSHSRGKPRKCTVAGCKDAIVHGRADQSMYRVNDFEDNARSDVSSRCYVYLRSCGRCYGNRIVSLSYLYARVRVRVDTCVISPSSWVYIGGRWVGKKHELNMTSAAQQLAKTSLSPKLKTPSVFPVRTFSSVRDITPMCVCARRNTYNYSNYTEHRKSHVVGRISK